MNTSFLVSHIYLIILNRYISVRLIFYTHYKNKVQRDNFNATV